MASVAEPSGSFGPIGRFCLRLNLWYHGLQAIARGTVEAVGLGALPAVIICTAICFGAVLLVAALSGARTSVAIGTGFAAAALLGAILAHLLRHLPGEKLDQRRQALKQRLTAAVAAQRQRREMTTTPSNTPTQKEDHGPGIERLAVSSSPASSPETAPGSHSSIESAWGSSPEQGASGEDALAFLKNVPKIRHASVAEQPPAEMPPVPEIGSAAAHLAWNACAFLLSMPLGVFAGVVIAQILNLPPGAHPPLCVFCCYTLYSSFKRG